MAVVRSSDAESGITTWSLLPSKDRAAPKRPPEVRVGPLMVPVFAWPDVSVAVVPVGSSNPYAATRPVLSTFTVIAADVVVLPEVSRATARS